MNRSMLLVMILSLSLLALACGRDGEQTAETTGTIRPAEPPPTVETTDTDFALTQTVEIGDTTPPPEDPAYVPTGTQPP